MLPDENLGTEGTSIFDLVEGANFILKIKNVQSGQNTFRNYDDSAFSVPSKISVELDSLYSLEQLVSPDNFKPYEELEKRLNKVLGMDTDEDGDSTPQQNYSAPKAQEPEKTPVKNDEPKAAAKPAPTSVDDIDMSEIDAMFKDLG